MLFKPLLVERIRRGEKTTTRRRSVHINGRQLRYKAGSQYALQPGRGKKHVGHLRVLDVRAEPLGGMSGADAGREGFACIASFKAYWRGLHRGYDGNEIVTVIDFEYLGERDCCADFEIDAAVE